MFNKNIGVCIYFEAFVVTRRHKFVVSDSRGEPERTKKRDWSDLAKTRSHNRKLSFHRLGNSDMSFGKYFRESAVNIIIRDSDATDKDNCMFVLTAFLVRRQITFGCFVVRRLKIQEALIGTLITFQPWWEIHPPRQWQFIRSCLTQNECIRGIAAVIITSWQMHEQCAYWAF